MAEVREGRHSPVIMKCLCIVFSAVIISGTVSSAKAADEILFAMITARTGEAGKSQAVSFDGARFTVDCINERGGILGHRVRLLEFDNHGTPEGSAEAARQAVAAGAVAVVDCNGSSHSMAMAKIFQKARVPMILHMSTNESVTRVGDFIFRICFTDSFQGGGLARFVLDNFGAATAVVLVDVVRTYSKGLARAFTTAFTEGGGTVVWRGEYEAGTLNADGLLRETARYQPDVVFVPGGYADVADLFGRAQGYGIRARLLSGDGIGLRLYEYMGAKADGIYYSGHWSRWGSTSESRDFITRFQKRLGHAPEDTLALVYDCFMVLREAIERAGSLDAVKIRDALAATSDFPGVTGALSFDENGDSIKPLVISRFKFGGVMYVGSVLP